MAYRETVQIKVRKQTRRHQILLAAREHIARGGYQAAQMQALAQACGIATGTVYRYFPSKADLFAEVFRLVVQKEVDAVDAAAQGETSAPDRLEAVIHTFIHRALRAPRLAYALLAEPVDPLVERERLVFRRSYAQIIEDLLREGIATETFAQQNPKISAAALVGVLNETLVGPLSPTPQIHPKNTDQLPRVETQNTSTDAEESELINATIALCMRAVTGRRSP